MSGNHITRSDAILKVTGQAKYTGDHKIAGNGFCQDITPTFTWSKT